MAAELWLGDVCERKLGRAKAEAVIVLCKTKTRDLAYAQSSYR